MHPYLLRFRLLIWLVIFSSSFLLSWRAQHNSSNEKTVLSKVANYQLADTLSEYNHPYLQTAKQVEKEKGRDAALVPYQQALSKFEKEGNIEGKIYCNNWISDYYLFKFDTDSALPYLDASSNLSKQLKDTVSVFYADFKYVMGLYYDLLGQPYQALRFHNEALNLKKDLQGDHQMSIAKSYKGIGDVYQYGGLRDYYSASDHYLKAENILAQLSEIDTTFQHLIYYAHARAKRLSEDTESAIIYANKALDIIKKDSMQNLVRLGLCYNILANTYNDLGDSRQAIQYYKLAINSIHSDFPATLRYLGTFYNGLGVIYLDRGEYDNADQNLKKSIKFFQMYNVNDPTGITLCLINIGRNYTKLNKIDSANFYFEKALIFAEEHFGSESKIIGNVYNFQGNLLLQQGKASDAAQLYQKALHMYNPQFIVGDLHNLPPFSLEFDNYDIFNLVIKKGRALKYLYDESKDRKHLDAALNCYLFADTILDLIRNSELRENSLIQFNQNFVKDQLDIGIDCAYELHALTQDQHYLEDAFRLVEKSKYMILLDAVVKQHHSESFGIPKVLLDQENNLKVEMTYYRELLAETESEDEMSIYKDKIFEIAGRQKALKDTIKINYPKLYRIRYDSISANIKNLQAELNDTNHQIFEYYVGQNFVYLLKITAENTEFIRIDKPKELLHHIDQYLTEITANGISVDLQSYQAFCQSAHYLYQSLLGDHTQIDSTKNDLNITIIPHDILSVVPFEAFIKSTPYNKNKVDYKNLPYLIHHANISYAYSANLLIQHYWNQQEVTFPKLLAFAYSENSEGHGDQQNEIYGTEREIDLIAKNVSLKKYQGASASENTFKIEAPTYDILHLAVHGSIDTTKLSNNALVFRTMNDTIDDGILHDYELYNLDLSAKLVVLSACETGIGKNIKGEGIFSMARGFAYAGCPSIIMSYWKANDQLTALLMEEFYDHLSVGMRINQSLQKAKLAMLENGDELTAHPSNWAAFVALGNANSRIYPAKRSLWTLAGYVVLIGLGAAIFLYLVRRISGKT